MILPQLIELLKHYDGDFPIYIDVGTGEFPLEMVVLDYINSEEGVLVLKSYNLSKDAQK